MSYAHDNGYLTRPGEPKPSVVDRMYDSERYVDKVCACGAVEKSNSRVWERCRKCAAERHRQKGAQYRRQAAARRKAVGR